jgi:hypothetical protein
LTALEALRMEVLKDLLDDDDDEEEEFSGRMLKLILVLEVSSGSSW